MSKTICTEYEVKKYSPADADYPAADICPNISITERVAFSKCILGLDYYSTILSDLEPTDFDVYEVKAYSEGERVIYNGKPYESEIEANTDTPDDGNWKLVRKFKSDEMQALWDEGGLKEWLCFQIFHDSVKFSHFRSSANGTTKAGDTDGRSKLTNDEFRDYKRGIKYTADNSLELLYAYMKKNNLLPGEDGCDCGGTCSSCKPPTKRRSRFKWATNS